MKNLIFIILLLLCAPLFASGDCPHTNKDGGIIMAGEVINPSGETMPASFTKTPHMAYGSMHTFGINIDWWRRLVGFTVYATDDGGVAGNPENKTDFRCQFASQAYIDGGIAVPAMNAEKAAVLIRDNDIFMVNALPHYIQSDAIGTMSNQCGSVTVYDIDTDC